MSRFGAKTYSRREVKTNLQFDQLLSDNKNKPSTAKVSVAGVHRWGVASFTSIRKTQLEKQAAAAQEKTNSKRRKMEKKVEPPDRGSGTFCEDPFSFDSDGRQDRFPTSSVGQIAAPVVSGSKSSMQSKPNKFFKSREVRPLAAQNSPKIEPVPARETGFKSQKDLKFKQLSLETFSGSKKMDFNRPSTMAQENFVQQKATENIDLLCLQNPDPMEERSPAHSDNSPLPDYFGLPDSCERTEEQFLPNTSDKFYSPPDYSSEFDNLLMSQKDSTSETMKKRVQSSLPVRASSDSPTRACTRSQKRAEENIVLMSPVAGPHADKVSTRYNASRPTGTFSQEFSSTSEVGSSVNRDGLTKSALPIVPRTLSESLGVEVSDSSSFQLSQESKASARSFPDSQQSNSENEFGDHHHHHRLKAHHSALKSRRIFNSPKLKKATYQEE